MHAEAKNKFWTESLFDDAFFLPVFVKMVLGENLWIKRDVAGENLNEKRRREISVKIWMKGDAVFSELARLLQREWRWMRNVMRSNVVR